MRFTMFVTEEIAQINLEPESEHEKKFIRIITDYHGGMVSIKLGASISECQGGYLRDFGQDKGNLAIVLKKKTE